MNHREFIAVVAGAAAWPLGARASEGPASTLDSEQFRSDLPFAGW
jgi:hypothetical protein